MSACPCCEADLPPLPASIDIRFADPEDEPATPCVLPVQLSGGVTLMIGTWLRTDLGTLANRIEPFDLLGEPVTTRLRDDVPWVVDSPSPRVAAVLADEWDRDYVLGYFSTPLPVPVRTPVSDEWSVERSPGLSAVVTDGVLEFSGPGRTVRLSLLEDALARAPEEFLGDLMATEPEVPPEQMHTETEGDEIRHMSWDDGLWGFVVRPGTAVAVTCWYEDPADHSWARHVVNSVAYLE